MNFDKNVKKSFILKIQSGISKISGGKRSLEFAENAKNDVLEIEFLKRLSQVK